MVTLVLASMLNACGGPMTPGELSRSVDTIASASAEGRLVADGVARHRTKTTFARVRTRELVETVDHEAEKLSDATPQKAIAPKKIAAVKLAEEISQALGRIQISPDDSALADQIERRLEELSKRADELSKSL